MKLIDKMQQLSNNVGNAEREYHKAAYNAIKSLGGSVDVKWCEEEDEDFGLRVTFLNNDGGSTIIRVDKVFLPENSTELKVHINEEDYADADYDYYLSELGDAADYVLDAIDWGDADAPEPEEVTTQDTFQMWDVCYKGGKVERGVATRPLTTAKALAEFDNAVWVRGVK